MKVHHLYQVIRACLLQNLLGCDPEIEQYENRLYEVLLTAHNLEKLFNLVVKMSIAARKLSLADTTLIKIDKRALNAKLEALTKEADLVVLFQGRPLEIRLG
ncbi:MAG: hypothetical protein MUO26_00355 [Methanotrichaceae archaeon]|nr:hypothetical protein [Methanotrichaceae archaeon]